MNGAVKTAGRVVNLVKNVKTSSDLKAAALMVVSQWKLKI